jgi:tellurite resistance protein
MSSPNPPRLVDGQRNDFTFVPRPGPRTRDAMIAAAAAMALADGRADPAEHRGLLRFLKQNKMLLSLGRADTIERYLAEVGRATARQCSAQSGGAHSPGAQQPTGEHLWQDLADRLRPLAGMQAAHLVAAAAAFVAAADGVVHPGEVELLRSLREALGLEPLETSAGR